MYVMQKQLWVQQLHAIVAAVFWDSFFMQQLYIPLLYKNLAIIGVGKFFPIRICWSVSTGYDA